MDLSARKPFIIAGISRSGKTTLARRLQKQTGFSLVSGDALMCTFESIFPELGIGHESDWKTVCRKWEDFLLVYLNHMLTYENIPFILDTCHLLPEQVAKRDLHKKYHVVFLGYPSRTPQEKLQDIRTYKTGHYDWTDEREDAELAATLERFVKNSAYIETECQKYNLPFIDTSTGFNDALDQAYKNLEQL